MPEDAGFTEVCSWVDGHLWTFDTQTLNLIDTEPLFGGHTLGASGGSQNLVYLISPDGMAIHVYSIP